MNSLQEAIYIAHVCFLKYLVVDQNLPITYFKNFVKTKFKFYNFFTIYD